VGRSGIASVHSSPSYRARDRRDFLGRSIPGRVSGLVSSLGPGDDLLRLGRNLFGRLGHTVPGNNKNADNAGDAAEDEGNNATSGKAYEYLVRISLKATEKG